MLFLTPLSSPTPLPLLLTPLSSDLRFSRTTLLIYKTQGLCIDSLGMIMDCPCPWARVRSFPELYSTSSMLQYLPTFWTFQLSNFLSESSSSLFSLLQGHQQALLLSSGGLDSRLLSIYNFTKTNSHNTVLDFLTHGPWVGKSDTIPCTHHSKTCGYTPYPFTTLIASGRVGPDPLAPLLFIVSSCPSKTIIGCYWYCTMLHWTWSVAPLMGFAISKPKWTCPTM